MKNICNIQKLRMYTPQPYQNGPDASSIISKVLKEKKVKQRILQEILRAFSLGIWGGNRKPRICQIIFMMLLTCRLKIRSLILQRPVDGVRPPHCHAFHFQNIAHFLNFGNSLFQVIFGKIKTSVFLVKWPVLFICIGLEAEESKWKCYRRIMQLQVDSQAGNSYLHSRRGTQTANGSVQSSSPALSTPASAQTPGFGDWRSLNHLVIYF